jgi:2-polyprenyl-3-methyl-5-hydroxy-6-metoxy-1,4-benzoquinol methylase
MKKIIDITVVAFVVFFSFQIITRGKIMAQDIDWSKKLAEYETPTKMKLLLGSYFETAEIKGEVVLDAGCGKGFFARILTARGYEVVGIDINGDLESDDLFHFQKANIVSFESDHKFETILLVNVLSCVSFKERLLILKNLKSLKTEDGLVYVVNTNADLLGADPAPVSDLFKVEKKTDDLVHLKMKKVDDNWIEFDDYLITKKEMSKLCEASGLEIIDRIDFQHEGLEKPFFEMYLLK